MSDANFKSFGYSNGHSPFQVREDQGEVVARERIFGPAVDCGGVA